MQRIDSARAGQSAAHHDVLNRFVDAEDVVSYSDVITRLLETQLNAAWCRGYVAFLLIGCYIDRPTADMILGEVAPDQWLVRTLPESYLVELD